MDKYSAPEVERLVMAILYLSAEPQARRATDFSTSVAMCLVWDASARHVRNDDFNSTITQRLKAEEKESLRRAQRIYIWLGLGRLGGHPGPGEISSQSITVSQRTHRMHV
jgi:hypothetical protein